MKKLTEQERDCKYLIDNPDRPRNETYRTLRQAKSRLANLKKEGYKHIIIIDQYPDQW